MHTFVEQNEKKKQRNFHIFFFLSSFISVAFVSWLNAVMVFHSLNRNALLMFYILFHFGHDGISISNR